jgi:predicted O-methyltransferase YrrM
VNPSHASTPKRGSALNDPRVSKTLDRLHSAARADWRRMLRIGPQYLISLLPGRSFSKLVRPAGLKGAYMAVPRKTGRLLYSITRSMKAQKTVEFGSSFGVSTIYLAAAARDNGGTVITTEIEPQKCRTTQSNLREAGLDDVVRVLQGDALVTLEPVEGPVDFLFLDGWIDLYEPILDLLIPKLRTGAVVIADNVDFGDAREYLARVQAPTSEFVTTVVEREMAFTCFVGQEG